MTPRDGRGVVSPPGSGFLRIHVKNTSGSCPEDKRAPLCWKECIPSGFEIQGYVWLGFMTQHGVDSGYPTVLPRPIRHLDMKEWIQVSSWTDFLSLQDRSGQGVAEGPTR
jgi:hypothetical protein